MEALGPKYLGWRGGAGRDDWRAGQKHLATPETPLGSRAETPKLYGSEPDCTEDSKVTKEARDKNDQTRSSSSVGSEGRERGCVWVQRVAALMGT